MPRAAFRSCTGVPIQRTGPPGLSCGTTSLPELSMALTVGESGTEVIAIDGSGSDVVPQLKAGGPVRWIGTPVQLRNAARGMRLHGHLYYAVPGKGFTLGQALLAHTVHGSAVAPSVSFQPGTQLGSVHRGQIVRLQVGATGDWQSQVRSLLVQLHARGLHAVPAAQLVADPD